MSSALYLHPPPSILLHLIDIISSVLEDALLKPYYLGNLPQCRFRSPNIRLSCLVQKEIRWL